MNAYLISIGDEILIGQIVNTNAAWLSKQLNLIGFNVKRILSIGDSRSEILWALNEASNNSNLVLITGGLGPTSDDITKPCLYEYFNSFPVLNQQVLSHIEQLLSNRGVKMSELNSQQAIVASNCEVIHNSCGTAPGMWFEKDKIIYIAMPGVPFEMETMMENTILPKIKNHFNTPSIYHKTILTTGIAESHLASLIEGWEKQLPENIKLAYLPSPGIVKLRLSITGEKSEIIKKEVDHQIQLLLPTIQQYIFGNDEEKLEEIIGKLLNIKNKTISTAESCTGGNIAKLITSISGSSSYFVGSIVAYSNNIKIAELGVDESDLMKYGAVSQQVVEAMAKGAMLKFKTDYAIAVTGIAGPLGGSVEKPVGTTWIAISSTSKIISKKYNFGEHRERNITKASITAMNMLRELLQKRQD